jgi:predicted  nucleic acid-binding Zn-ribbon protein
MVKTEFMKLYEELGNINEAITDIDLDSISTTAAEAKRLWQEVWDLERDLDKKVSSAYTANEEYKKLRAEYLELDEKLRALKQTYERREWVQVGRDDWEHDDWIDESEYEKVKDQVKELYKVMGEIDTKLEAIKTEAKNQFNSDAEVIKSKRAEMETHKATNTELTTKLRQSYPEVEAEINEVINFLNDSDNDYAFGSDFWKASKNLFYADGRIQTALYTELTCDGDRFEPDDFNSSGELTERSEKWEAQSMIDDAGASADGIIPYFELEESEDGWYKIPGSDWELCKQSDYDVDDVPSIDYDGYYDDYEDYEIDGEFKISANIYLGKRVKK